MFYKVNKPEVLLANKASAIRVESLCYYIPSHAQYRTRVQAWNIVHNKRSKLLARLLLQALTTYRTSRGKPLHRQTNSTLLTTVSRVSIEPRNLLVWSPYQLSIHNYCLSYDRR